jgi:hypothetical protein
MITDEDLWLFDLLTLAYRSFTIITDLTDILIFDEKNESPATQFYFKWCETRLNGKYEIPLNPGTIWMISSTIIVNSKERWLHLLPKTPLSEIGPEWGLKDIKLHYLSNPDPSISEIVHKIRNAISHSDFVFKIGREEAPWDVFLKESTFTFKDSRGEDLFELEISMSDLSKLNSTVYQTIQSFFESYKDKISR